MEGTFISITNALKKGEVDWVNLIIPITATNLQDLEIYGDWDRFKNADSFGYD